MSRILRIVSVLALALGVATATIGGDARSRPERARRVSPGSPFCVTGPIFEQVRGPIDEAEEVAWAEKHGYEDDTTIEGRIVTAVKYVYRDQPPEFLIYPTTNSLDPIVYMATEFTPKSCKAFVRVDFNVQVSVVPGDGGFAGLGYSIYVKEDGGDGHISHPGEDICSGDDICGYLEQTEWGLWLVASTNELQYNSAATSNFFRARCHRTYEIQVHVYPVYDWTMGPPGEIWLNAGFMGLTSGK